MIIYEFAILYFNILHIMPRVLMINLFVQTMGLNLRNDRIESYTNGILLERYIRR